MTQEQQTEQAQISSAEEIKMAQYMLPVESAVKNAQTPEELLMIASVMIYKSRLIFDALIGEEQRKLIFRNIADGKI